VPATPVEGEPAREPEPFLSPGQSTAEKREQLPDQKVPCTFVGPTLTLPVVGNEGKDESAQATDQPLVGSGGARCDLAEVKEDPVKKEK
jgi:hypothetical protein